MIGLRAQVRSPFVTADITAAPGEIVAVLGPNGSGKTSLLRAILGLAKGTTTVELDGRDVSALPVEERRIGWLPQAPSLFAHLSARDNVVFAMTARGVSRSRSRPVAEQWLDRLGVGDVANKKPGQLSGGQVARVGLARALVADPQLVLLDEPLSALDSATRDEVRQLLRSTLSGGAAPVLLVTHDPVDVAALADRLVVLEAGRVMQTGTPAEVIGCSTQRLGGRAARAERLARHDRRQRACSRTVATSPRPIRCRPGSRRWPCASRQPSRCTGAGPRAPPATCCTGRCRRCGRSAGARGCRSRARRPSSRR